MPILSHFPWLPVTSTRFPVINEVGWNKSVTLHSPEERSLGLLNRAMFPDVQKQKLTRPENRSFLYKLQYPLWLLLFVWVYRLIKITSSLRPASPFPALKSRLSLPCSVHFQRPSLKIIFFFLGLVKKLYQNQIGWLNLPHLVLSLTIRTVFNTGTPSWRAAPMILT